MTDCNPNKVPLKISVNLDEIASHLPRTQHPETVSLYTQLIGEFMFMTITTQPIIVQPVKALARFMTTANSELYMLAKGVLRYLKCVKSRKIIWCDASFKFPFVSCEIYVYSDASWTDIVPQCKNSLNSLIFCNSAGYTMTCRMPRIPGELLYPSFSSCCQWLHMGLLGVCKFDTLLI